MTGWANDQGFASFLEHDLRPMRSIFSHRCQFGKFAYLVNHALFVFDSTEFTGACYESSHYLPSLIASHAGYSINHYGFVVSHQRNSAKAGHQRLLATTSKQRCLKALSRAVRRLDGAWKRFAIRWVVLRYFAANVWVKDCWTIHLYPLNQDTLLASK